MGCLHIVLKIELDTGRFN